MPIRLPDADRCYFCEIVRGADRWNIVEQTSLTLTILNGRQYEQGQCIVVPLRHVPTLLELRVEEEHAVMAAARRAAHALVKALDPDGVLLYQNNGVGSGQEVPHFHLHVVPRTPGSDWGFGPPHLARLDSRAAHLDQTVVTDAKRRTAALLKRHYVA